MNATYWYWDRDEIDPQRVTDCVSDHYAPDPAPPFRVTETMFTGRVEEGWDEDMRVAAPMYEVAVEWEETS